LTDKDIATSTPPESMKNQAFSNTEGTKIHEARSFMVATPHVVRFRAIAVRLEALQELAVRVSGERSVDAVLQSIVNGLAQQPSVALVRVWVTGPGDVCGSCLMRDACPDHTACLHLSASAGMSLTGEPWSRIDGAFRRVPFGNASMEFCPSPVRAIATDRTGQLLHVSACSQWAHPEWIQQETIESFAGHPLVFRGEVLGVLGMFRRALINEQEFGWLRMFANQAAAAVANAGAFSELDRLRQQLESHNAYLKEEVDSVLSFGRIVGRSRALRHVLQQVDDVASSGATVLITGESGTGKELLAREIHERSRRSQRAFVRVNCSAIPREMFESEFFGHVRGAFTGAIRDRPGRFQIANGGTIFLDEIGDLPLELQPKLLRVLQEGEYERVGEDVTRKVDVRVIAATNKSLAEEVRAHRFRQDLFYRLDVFPLAMPPLRARTDDIPLLATHAIAEVSKRLRTEAPTLTQEDVARLQQYDWPGNIRELHNVIERAVILSKGVRLRLDIALADTPSTATAVPDMPEVILTDRECRARERTNLMKALQRTDGRIYGAGGAAELLGINPTTLASRLRALKITLPKPR
jgi:transcriptional regulator with GAF, ATPase, and Fis domain